MDKKGNFTDQYDFKDQTDEDVKGQSVQIIDIKKDSQSKYIFNLKENALKKILDQVGNHEVFISAIAGPSRQGKSFMLSFMLRYLENYGKKDWLGRDKPNQKLKGFHWKNGDEAETLGIWMWSKPFFVKNSSGKEIAVLLVDTQGVFDNILTNREWAIIVGLCLLTCSSTIFNLFSHLQENSLQVLDTFMAYGLAAMCCDDNDGPEYPFQKLVFLIRDHNNPDQYPYGKIGGKKLLDSKLKIKDDMQRETQLTRKNIKRCFSELECYLMPPIGEEAKRVTYDGNLNVLPEKFISNLEEFVSTLLNSDKLSSKLIAGNPVKGRDLLKFFQTYIDIFNSGDIPDPKPLLDATATVNYANASNEAVHQIYVPYMTDKLKKVNFLSDGELVKTHKFVLQKANQLLKNKPKMGDPLILENSLVSLNKILNEEFIRLSDANKTKMQLFLQKLVEDCTRDFKEIVDSSVNKVFWFPHEVLQNLLSNSEKNIIENFDTMCEDAESEALQPYLEKLKNSIKTHNEVIINDNKRKLQEAEKYCSEAIENALHNYTASMESELSKKKYFNAKDLESVHTNSLLLAIDIFNEAEKIGDEDFIQKYDLLLRNQVNKTFLSFEKDNTLKMEMCYREQEKEVSVLIMNYRKGLQSFLTNEQIDMEEFERNEKIIKLQCDEQFNLLSQSCVDAESTAKLKDTYESSIVDCKFEYELKCQTSIEKRENNLSKLVSKLVENYEERASQIKSSLSFISKVQLEEFHEKCSHEVIKDFEDSFPTMTAIETKFLEELKEKLMKKGTKMTQENEARNDTLMKSSDIIKFESKSIYIKDMKSIMSDIFNREDLTIKHNELKEKALGIFMTQNQFHDEDYVETSIKCLNEEIEEEFAIIENNFTADRSKLAQSLMNDEVEAYQNKITAKLNDSEQDLEIIHQSLLEEATAGFKSAMRHISNEEQHFLQKLKDKFDTIFTTISDENKIKKLNSEKCAQLVYIQVKKRYFDCMKTCVDSILDENELKKKHEEFEQIAKDEFMDECKLIDKQTLTKFLDKLSNEVDQEFKRFRELFDERLETNMTNFITDEINKYELKLMEKFETSYNISNVALEELHNICLNEAQNNFKKIYNSHSTAEEHHLIKLCDGFDNTHKKITSEILKKQENQMMRAKFMISDLKNQYFHQIKSCFNQISSKSDLRAKHESLIKALEEKFKRDFNEYDQNEVNSLISNVINECETFFVSFMESFKEKKQTDLRAVIDREISNYSIKINKNIDSVPVLEETLKEYHQTFLDEAVHNFKEFVDNFSAEEEDSLRSMISEIEDYFQKVIKENDNLISNLEKSAQIIIFELKNEYNMRMRSNTGESISRDELQLKHQHFKNEIIEQFRKNKLNEGGILERLVTKLSDYIENEFIIVSDPIIQNRGMALDKAISEIATEFHIKLDEKTNDEKSLKAEELQDFYNKERDLIIENFKTNFKICENEHKYIETLIEKLKFFFDKITIRIEKKNETSLKNSQNVISELKNKYNEKMKTCLNEAEDENVLKEKHNKFKDEALNDLKLKLIGLDSILLENSTEQLFNELESIFCDVLELFKINNEVLELKLKSFIDTAKNCYITEMDQNISKNKLLTEEQLSKIHELSKILAFNKLVENSSSKNVPKSIREELNGSLEVIFNNYRKDNKLKSRKTESIGIDLGTTFCCVGVVINGKVKLIPLENEKTTLPSYISFTPSGEELFGTAAKEQAYENPSNTIYDAKRLIGRNFDDKLTKIDMKCWPFAIISDNNKPKVELRCSSRTTLHAEEICAKILRKLKEITESYLNCEIKNAVITVPAYFNDAQRQATKDAGCIAGLKVLKILNEPTSAAVAYSYQTKDDSPKNIFVFDLGGGTFDVAIVVIDKGNIHVKAVGGDTHLGGQDFDQRIIELCKKEFGKKLDDKALQRLKNKCEQKKLDLTYNKETTISIDALMRGKDFRMTLTRSTFEEINKDLFDKTMALVSKALFDARMEPSNIDEVILVGGSTRIPKIQELLSEYFKGKPLNKSINPDEAVAYGAAIQAAILDGDPSIDADKYLIQDVAPFNIGVEVEDGTNSIIIPKNTKLPCQNTECYVTVHNNQKIIAFKIYEGDDRIAMNNKLLGEFRLEGLPPKPAGQEEADVTMTIDDEGILHVKARSRSTFNSKKITIQDSRLRIPEGELKMLIRKGKY